MNDMTLDKFTCSLLILLPGYAMTSEQIKARIKERGYTGFIKDAGEPITSLVKTVDLISVLEKGGRNGKGKSV
jgi:hypothetical protein